MSKTICHDLKTERTDVLPPLPAVARVLPVGFYLAIVGSLALSGFYYWQLKTAESDKATWLAREQTEKADQEKIVNETKVVNSATKRAEEVKTWINGSKGIQLLVARVARSMAEGSTISELRFTRDSSDPSKIKTALRLNEGGGDQLEDTLEVIERESGYRPYEARKKGRPKTGEIDFDAILIKAN